ncbi:NAD(P)-dependent dehydrogenase (short-subunit alcohol dehydrogenase family) [Palleronia aestuarii]|uniref:NAD(P)-dependent dehydrogenase (Short-subunit alcohol dehydrogenase family) n=1 Tax=Palleronia aestuarii TaxID=568105 RepID=A0A2W7N4A2_9RHOB|nr:SDR family oxidoreductase [Palleronia aestuarii]PZX14918.1 NAD(P)-dependent dehydrogenase (short-subunit alcohol dehydrogenase family) [Palleronia aestuarii]
MDLGLQGHRVIVTAGAAGIGRAIVEAFRAEGARVVTCDIDETALSTLPDDVTGFSADMGNAEAVAGFMERAIDVLGGLDTLVNNAGTAGPTGPVDEIDPADWEACLRICLTSQFHCTRHAVPALKQSDNASIANISSLAGRLGFALRTPYAAAKWGVIGFTKSLSLELGPDGIRANAILPGLVAGERQRRVLEAKAQRQGRSFAEVEGDALSYTGLRSYVQPEEIADQILFLASPRGRTISGQAISVCADTQMLA